MTARFPLLEILQSIATASVGATVNGHAPLADEIHGWQEKLAAAFTEQLDVEVSAIDVESARSLFALANMIEPRLPRDAHGHSIVNIYLAVEKIVREELSHDVNYHWHGTWLGDVLNKTDSLDDVEIVIRMEDTFGISIPDRDAQQMHTVGQTVRYLWRGLASRVFVASDKLNNIL